MTQILVVDDNEENLYYLKVLLQGHGYEVGLARHGAEALLKARQSPPDLVISDLLMPIMDGYTLLRHWRLDARLKAIPFMVYTATYTEPEDERLAFSLGADAFILKPCEPDAFISQFEEVLARPALRVGEGAVPASGNGGDPTLKQYSESLIRKLEEKTLRLEEANLELEQDIARRRAAEMQVEQLAYYDPLTGLPNRRLMRDRLGQGAATTSRLRMHGALMFIDIDNFKVLNDTRGHEVGDQFLRDSAARLQSVLGAGDTLARVGGDEFAVILKTLDAKATLAASAAESIGERLLQAIAQPYMLAGEQWHASASIGVTLFGDASHSVDELIRRADAALHQSKRNGRNNVHFYDAGIQAALQAKTQLEGDLRHALVEKEFELYYQPMMNQAGVIVAAEALIRWNSRDRGMVAPDQFIPLAEETGLIVPIGLWVLEAACLQLNAWQGQPGRKGLQLSVNVSLRQFSRADFVDQVVKIVAATGIVPALLKLELTESVVLDDIDAALAKIRALNAVGIKFAMDDFGTGYSSLSYLTRLSLDQIKIDKSFVRDIGSQSNSEVIVKAILGIAASLQLAVVAEGVETEAQFQFLKEHGCHLFQGYYIGKPVAVGEFNSHIAQRTGSA